MSPEKGREEEISMIQKVCTYWLLSPNRDLQSLFVRCLFSVTKGVYKTTIGSGYGSEIGQLDYQKDLRLLVPTA